MNFDIEDYKGKYVMHCKTEEEAKVFCKYLDSVGRCWSSHKTYDTDTNWYHYREETCYNFNEGTFCPKISYETQGYIFLEMEDFMEDFMEENKDMNYVDSIFKVLNIKPNEPIMLHVDGLKFLAKISPELRIYRYIGEHNTVSGEKDEWIICSLTDIRSILLGKTKIEKPLSEEDKRVIEYWKYTGFHYLAKDKDEEVYAFFYKPIKDEKRGSWDVGKEFRNDDPLKWANTYRKCDFLSWEDDEPYCLD